MSTDLANYTNNAYGTLLSDILAGATNLTLQSGEGDLFPSTYPFYLTLETYTGDNVTTREIVKVTNRASDTFTIVRSAEYCRQSYDDTTPANTAHGFSSGDTVRLDLTAGVMDTTLQEDDVVDNLTSTDTDRPLSANQGKHLEDNKLESDGELRTGLTANKLFYSNGSGAETELAFGAVGRVLIGQGTSTPPIRGAQSTDIDGLAEITETDNDNDKMIVYDDSVSGNRKIKVKNIVADARDFIFGDGSNGSVTISTSTTLTKDMYYTNLTINSGVVLNTGGYKIFVSGTLTNNGTIRNNGSNGANGGDATDAPGTTSDPSKGLGGDGGNGGLGLTIKAGATGGDGGDGGWYGSSRVYPTDGETLPIITTGLGNNGGNGGDGNHNRDYGVGGVSGVITGTQPKSVKNWLDFYSQDFSADDKISYYNGSNSGGGGGGGGNRGVDSGTKGAGGGGGGGGGAGGIIYIISKNIMNSGTIESNGGNGGNGGDGSSNANGTLDYTIGAGGGGAGGGGGGVVIQMYSNKTDTGTIQTLAGTKGTGGLGSNRGVVDTNYNGEDGNNGNPGKIYNIQIV